ncbi:MAG: hypothetical protein ACKO0Z_07350 [Betaproteobacteria bacterium]
MTVLAVMTALCNARSGSVPANSRGTHIQTPSAGGPYDSAYADRSIFVQREVSEPFLDLGANKTDFWLHYDMYVESMGAGSTGFIEFRSQSGTLQLVIQVTASLSFEFQKSTNGTSGAGSLSGTSFSISASTRHTFDIKVSLGASGEIKFYKDGTLVFTYTGDLTTNGDNAIRYVTWKGTDPRSRSKYISQVVADTGSTVGFKVFNTYPINVGTFTDWTGSWVGKSNQSFTDEAAGTYANTVGHKTSWTGVSLPAGASGMAVRAVANTVRAYVTPGATPQSVAAGVRFGTTNYEGDTYALDALKGIQYVQHIWNTNPQTGLQWTYSDVGSIGFTYIAKA